MDAKAISQILADLESDRVERTISTTKTDKFCEAVCAFANDYPQNNLPGYLILGADDKTGEVAGIEITDLLLRNLAGIRSDGNIQPLPALTVQRFTLGVQGDVAVVEVHPSDLPPVRYRGRIWIRVGPTRAVASEQEERILTERRVSAARSFDARPCLEASVSDLSIRLFEAYRGQAVDDEVIRENHRSIEEQLASLRFLDSHTRHPTNAGLVLFGLNTRFFLPGAYVQFIQLPGVDITDVPIDAAEISGDLLSVLEELLLRIRVVNTKGLVSKTSLQEELRPKYPDVALREIIMNAVVHRSYESSTPIRFSVFANRIEIASPGGLYGEVNRANFGSGSSYRNPVIAEAMKVMGFVNRFGYGLRRAEKTLVDNGNPPLEVTIEDNAVLVTIIGLVQQ